jgi:asparaginyl-tRNA synthetase
MANHKLTKNSHRDIIKTSFGKFSKKKYNALINVRSVSLQSIRNALRQEGYSEVSTSSLVNIAGSCEDPYSSFALNFHGKEAYLSQSAQLQLETLVIRLKRKVFTVNSSFRAEDYKDPEKRDRTLSEFTLVEPEGPYENQDPEKAFDELTNVIERVIKKSLEPLINNIAEEIELLGGDINYLDTVRRSRFNRISYGDALNILSREGKRYDFGTDFGIIEERRILEYFDGIPTFVTYFPAKIKFFNMKRTTCGSKVFAVDLLTPKLGETVGGALREENGEKIKEYLFESNIGKFLKEKRIDPDVTFGPYLDLFEEEKAPLRGGFGIGFERFVAFVLGSTDILETIAYKSLQP